MSLPGGYKRLEYIQSSGTQYIDTGISVGPDNASALKSVIDKMILTTNAYSLDGTGYGAAPYNNSFYLGTDANRNIAYGDGRVDKTTSTAYDGSRRTFVYDAQNGKVSVSNLTEISFTFSAPDTALNFLLFAYNQGTQGGVKYYSGRIYGAKLYINGILVRDFVPCVNASGEVGLWDDVNSVFYANAGTGTFTAGPENPAPEDPTALQTVLAVVLQWAASANADRYDVYRDGAKIGSTETTQYVDATPEANQTYVYTVKAVNVFFESAGTSITVYTKSGYFEYKPLIESANFP